MDKINSEESIVDVLGQGGYMIVGVLFFAVMMTILYRLAIKKDNA